MLNERLKQVYSRSWALIRMIDVRWNSAQAAAASLLRIRTGFQTFVQMNKIKRGFPEALLPAEKDEFWNQLGQCEAIVRPLCYANLMLQK